MWPCGSLWPLLTAFLAAPRCRSFELGAPFNTTRLVLRVVGGSECFTKAKISQVPCCRTIGFTEVKEMAQRRAGTGRPCLRAMRISTPKGHVLWFREGSSSAAQILGILKHPTGIVPSIILPSSKRHCAGQVSHHLRAIALLATAERLLTCNISCNYCPACSHAFAWNRTCKCSQKSKFPTRK